MVVLAKEPSQPKTKEERKKEMPERSLVTGDSASLKNWLSLARCDFRL